MFLSVMLLLGTLAMLTTTEPVCDPETQYVLNEECCLKCQPGTSMVSTGECRNPVCKECDENEYMDTYNTEAMCQRQPYCDPNSNFRWLESTSTTIRHQCLCKRGFHCSSKSCTTCVPHTECEQGYGATLIGDHTHDTVCEKCPDGTFSEEKSWNSTCNNSKNTMSSHVGVIISSVLFALVIIGIAVALYIYKGRAGHELFKRQPVIENDDSSHSCKVDINEEENTCPFITNPTDDKEPTGGHFQQTYLSGPPVENEDVVYTAKGNLLSQDGKEHVISQPETQTIITN